MKEMATANAHINRVDGHRALKAFEYATKAVEATEAQEPGYLDTLAEAYYSSGQFEKAIQTIQKAIALQPDRVYFKEQLLKFQQASEAE